MRAKTMASCSTTALTAKACGAFIKALVCITADGGLAANFKAQALATTLASDGTTTWLTQPTSKAASAMKGSPNNKACAARW